MIPAHAHTSRLQSVEAGGRRVLALAGVGSLAIVGALGIARYRVLSPGTESSVSGSLRTGTAAATGDP